MTSELRVVHLDEHLAVVDKPAGLVVHPAPSHDGPTLVDELAEILGGGADPERPGIVHRLDKETSGLLVVARSDEPLDAAAASPLSASGTWGPLLLTDDAGTLPAALRGYLLDVKPGYTDDPTRAFYNHIWVIGDEGAIDVNQQAEIDNLAELTKIGGER